MLQSSLLTSPSPSDAEAVRALWPASLDALIWRADDMGGRQSTTFASGFRPLDRELPGGGWPSRALTELLVESGTHCEWRLLAASLRRIQKAGGTVFLIGTPHVPHLPGLRLMGIDERRLVWVRAEGERERLWATQQVIQSGQAGALVMWASKADSRALRRLQACASSCEAPVFVIRPSSFQLETSPAPLRLEVSLGEQAWTLRVRVVKRRGPMLDGAIELPSVPGGLTEVLARRMAAAARQAEPKEQATRPEPAPLSVQAPLPFAPALVASSAVASATTPGGLTASDHAVAPPADLAEGKLVELSFPRNVQETPDELLAGALLPTPQRAVAG